MMEIIKVPHVEQAEDWDCGLACAQMVLGYCKIALDDTDGGLDSVCQQIGVKKAVWTIDLAHMMSLFGIPHQFHTITLGVDPTYNAVDFYNSDKFVFSNEECRINELFKNAAEKGISASKRSVSREEILDQLKEGHPAIVLIDDSILSCHMCNRERKGLDCFPSTCLSKSDLEEEEESGYVGHFIVACGFHIEEEKIFYKNPAKTVDLCCCSFANFDLARKSHGTDEDILFIKR